MTDADGPNADDDQIEGTFLVTAAESDSAVLKNVESGQVHTLSSNPGVERADVVEGVVAPDPPLNVSYQLIETSARRSLAVEKSDEPPTAHSQELAAAQDIGGLTREERAGTGEIHVITVPEGDTETAVDDVLDDEEQLLSRAARLGVNRVEVRSSPGVLSVRYMP
ncbi:DUF5812 family protein [Halobellus captivus]|uniref:DUF5812 family protein n=1 Tax=Halobellus captivus TaxID=2592614 RepID=UPI0011A8574A|nr:DUF5812 family protein [Halobellus captivus]